MGGDLARALAKQAKINIVLTGRRVLPPRKEWGKIGFGPAVETRIRLIQDLEKLGATVMYDNANVADIRQMTALLRRIKKIYGNLHGVVHAAGVWDSSTFNLLEKNLASFKDVLMPKVHGTIITDIITRKEPLKFFVMLSSVSATKKAWSAGLGDYAAASSFLDSYSSFRSSSNSPGKTLAVNFSLWKNKGMASNLGGAAILAVKAQGLNPLCPQKASAAFMRAVYCCRQNIIHVFELLEQAPKKAELAVSAPEEEQEPAVKKDASYMQPAQIKKVVRKFLARHLQIPIADVEEDKNFLEMGLDSAGAVKVVNSISKLVEKELYPTVLFEYQTVDALVRHIEKTHAADEYGPCADMSSTGMRERQDLRDVAIIGMSVKVPGANSLQEYWNLLVNGKCVIQEAPEDRWAKEDYFSPDADSLHTTYSNKGGFIDNPYDFDAMFFGISPNEAKATDPQQRIFLEIAWEALQQAGYGNNTYRTHNIGVFVGCEQNTYAEHFINYRSYMILKKRLESAQWFKNMALAEREDLMFQVVDVLKPAQMVPDAVPGNGINEIAARVSHCLDLTGPSLTVNTACSSSLVALHLACENIKSGQSSMAIVGGVNLNLSSVPFVSLSRMQALSATGNCMPFDDRTDGMVLSEGAGAIVIKPLDEAQDDGDHVYAVIKGSAINNDGHSAGITVPKPQGQAEVIRNVYINSNINPETVSYIETHGTGTPIGDPIEMEGMVQGFRSFTDKKGFCAIGSVKSCIGHMLAASGIPSLIKVVLAMQQKSIPPTVNYEIPNKNIDFANSPFYVSGNKNVPWNRTNGNPLRAGINAFGFGGTNTHVLIEEAPLITREAPTENDQDPYLLFITCQNQKVVQEVAQNLKEHINIQPDLALSSICFSMNNAQKELSYKTAAVVRSTQHLEHILEAIIKADPLPEIHQGRSNPNRAMPIHIIFNDSISSRASDINIMSRRFRIFAEAYDTCKKEYATLTQLDQIAGKSAIFAVQYAIGSLLQSLKITPATILSEGTGIIAGAALMGLISPEQGIWLTIKIDNGENPFKIVRGQMGTIQSEFGWKCPLITGSGTLEYSSNESQIIDRLISFGQKLRPEICAEFVNKGETYLYCGNSGTIKDRIGIQDEPHSWIAMDINTASHYSLLEVLARMYISGVKFNPNKLFSNSVRRVPLPTYPFQHNTYKISSPKIRMGRQTPNETGTSNLEPTPIAKVSSRGLVKVDMGMSETWATDPDRLARPRLIRIDKLTSITENQRRLSHEALSNDLLIQAGRG